MNIIGYAVKSYWSDEDDCWVAEVPALPGCTAHGDGPLDAMEEACIAAHLWLQVAAEMGREIPKLLEHMCDE